jgi:hypothetical protein
MGEGKEEWWGGEFKYDSLEKRKENSLPPQKKRMTRNLIHVTWTCI